MCLCCVCEMLSQCNEERICFFAVNIITIFWTMSGFYRSDPWKLLDSKRLLPTVRGYVGVLKAPLLGVWGQSL